MKKILFPVIVMMAVLMAGQPAFAQGNEPDQEKKVAYNLINEYGFFVGGMNGVNGVFVNGVRVNNEVVGIGLGYSLDVEVGQSVPMFLNYRHYFNSPRKLKPLLNVALGTSLYFWNNSYFTYTDPNSYEMEEHMENYHKFGLYATLASGFKVKAFSFTAGFFMKTDPRMNQRFGGGIDVKVGYTF